MFIEVLLLFCYYDKIFCDQMQQKFNQCDICIIYQPSPLSKKKTKKPPAKPGIGSPLLERTLRSNSAMISLAPR